MSAGEPTREEARAAIAEAAQAQVPVRSSDRLFAWRLLALAAAVMGMAALIQIFVLLPAWTGPLQGFLAGGGIAGAVALVVLASLRQHAFTRSGNRLFFVTLFVWLAWAEADWYVSTHSAWLGFDQPRAVRDLHLMLTAVIAVVPLLIGALVFRLRR